MRAHVASVVKNASKVGGWSLKVQVSEGFLDIKRPGHGSDVLLRELFHNSTNEGVDVVLDAHVVRRFCIIVESPGAHGIAAKAGEVAHRM